VTTTLKNAWVDSSAIIGRLATLVGVTATSGNTSVGTLYAADDATGTNPVVCCDFAGDPITGRTLTAHDVLDPGGSNYQTCLGVVLPAGKKFLRWSQASADTDNWTIQAMGC
jgi:hypothetical protein